MIQMLPTITAYLSMADNIALVSTNLLCVNYNPLNNCRVS